MTAQAKFPPPAAGLTRIDPATGVGFKLLAGQTLRVVDPCGEQVSDLLCYNATDLGEMLSNGRTFDYEEQLYLTAGHKLWSSRSRVMMTITHDDCGTHDLLLTPCSPETYKLLYEPEDSPRYGHDLAHHPNCFDNLANNLAPFGVTRDSIHATFNLFMNVKVDESGTIDLRPPTTQPGDAIELRAEMDLLIGLTACAAEKTNNGTLKPIDWQVL
jgi:uncharacterized protein YcgI (DUF1989 family)